MLRYDTNVPEGLAVSISTVYLKTSSICVLPFSQGLLNCQKTFIWILAGAETSNLTCTIIVSNILMFRFFPTKHKGMTVLWWLTCFCIAMAVRFPSVVTSDIAFCSVSVTIDLFMAGTRAYCGSESWWQETVTGKVRGVVDQVQPVRAAN
jgi:hypothetical protein